MIQQVPQTPARVVRLKTFAATGNDLAESVPTVEAAVNGWLATAGERRVVAVQWSVSGETATAAVWYVD